MNAPTDSADARENAPASLRLRIDGMHCAGCAATVERALLRVPGVSSAAVNHTEGSATVRLNGAGAPAAGTDVTDALVRAVRETGYDAAPEKAGASVAEARHDLEQRQHTAAAGWRRRMIVGIAL